MLLKRWNYKCENYSNFLGTTLRWITSPYARVDTYTSLQMKCKYAVQTIFSYYFIRGEEKKKKYLKFHLNRETQVLHEFTIVDLYINIHILTTCDEDNKEHSIRNPFHCHHPHLGFRIRNWHNELRLICAELCDILYVLCLPLEVDPLSMKTFAGTI
mgnify:CR=1 FL=1